MDNFSSSVRKTCLCRISPYLLQPLCFITSKDRQDLDYRFEFSGVRLDLAGRNSEMSNDSSGLVQLLARMALGHWGAADPVGDVPVPQGPSLA